MLDVLLKMGFPIYTCEEGFPDTIPDILRGLSSNCGIEVERTESRSDAPVSYSYEVKRGFGRISIYGGMESGLTNVMIVHGSMNPLRWRSNGKLLEEATQALLAGGMVELTADELIELTSRTEGKEEAEQDVDPNA